MVLIDTSVWIDFLSSKPGPPSLEVSVLLEQKQAATIHPIRAEILSGRMNAKTRETVRQAFGAMVSLDLDWNAGSVWDEIASLAAVLTKRRIPVPGIVDRMILQSAHSAGAFVWTYDMKLARACEAFGAGYR